VPQSCPHCKAWLPNTGEVPASCPKCLASLIAPDKSAEEDTDSPPSQLDKVAVLGNSIQFLFVVPMPLLLALFCGYWFVVWISRREFGAAAGMGLLLSVFGAVTYALVKSYLANIRVK